MISLRTFIRNTVALSVILTSGAILADDGIVRMSDRSAKTDSTPSVVQINAPTRTGIQRTSFESSGPCGEAWCPNQTCPPQNWTGPCQQLCDPSACGTSCNQNRSGCPCPSGCNSGMCNNGIGYAPMDCNTCFSSCDASGMPMCWCNKCGHSPCQCNGGRGRGCSNVCLFAGSVDCGTGSPCRNFWHGQSMSFRNKNARLANHLFGWLVPSGIGGQGSPPCGKYCMTYADQPDYMDPRDTQLYGTQKYGMPITVPLAPNVNHSYNYSSGLPASRITHIGTYNPNTSPQPLHHQTW